MASPTQSDTLQFDWRSWIAKQGFNAVLLAAFAYFLGFYIVIPMRDDQRDFMKSVISANTTNSLSYSVLVKAQQDQTANMVKLANNQEAIIDQGKQQATILQQIRDDQRRGAWKEADK